VSEFVIFSHPANFLPSRSREVMLAAASYPGEIKLVEEDAVTVTGSSVLGRAIAPVSMAVNRDGLSIRPQMRETKKI